MQGRKAPGPEVPEPPEARGDDEIAAAIRGGAPTDSHPVAKAGFDTNLPDDADDATAGAETPISSPRVGADEQVVPKKRRVLRSKGRGGPRRSPPDR